MIKVPRAFPTDYASVLQRLAQIDPIQYGKTRNFIGGAVTYLSPYISRGVISTRQALQSVLDRGFEIHQIEQFVKELCWRDYFQRVGQHKDLDLDIRNPQQPVSNHGMPVSVLQAKTGVEGIDQSIQDLFKSGYMHNHARMYVASLVCNVARSHWKNPSQWMYYHLLDGDWASNTCSWQWVAGANSSKKYYANQENINKYMLTNQRGTVLDVTYEELSSMEVPQVFTTTDYVRQECILPTTNLLQVDPQLPTFVYNYYNLDPEWHRDQPGNRVLLLDPKHFEEYPISRKCLDFALELSRNIPGMQVHVGSFQSISERCHLAPIYFKEHPLNQGYFGIEESRDWIAPDVTEYYPSFFGYWKQVEKSLRKNRPTYLNG